MIFLQACSANSNKSTDISSSNDDKLTKDDSENMDKPQINLANTCPRNLVCAFPGRCTLYSDRDYDKICDRSTTQEKYYDR